VLLVAGFAAVELESNSPGEMGNAPLQWPAETAVPRAADKPLLLMFLHPRCPCSDASVSELERLLARAGRFGSCTVVFVKPEGTADGWARTRLWDRVSAMPGVVPVMDAGGVEARRFGAMTSGVTLVYDTAGALVFHGGITGARGHEGDNAGKSLADCCMRGEQHDQDSTCVYGCPLTGEPKR
jgi:hypothetical protein